MFENIEEVAKGALDRGLGDEMTEKRARYLLSPKNLVLTEIARDYALENPTPLITHRIVEGGERVIDAICRAYASKCVRWGLFVPLPSKTMKALCGRSKGKNLYPQVLSFLEGCGILEINHRYSTGIGEKRGFPKSYKITRSFLKGIGFSFVVQFIDCSSRERRTLPEVSGDIQKALVANVARLRVDWDEIRNVLNHAFIPEERAIRIVESARRIDGGRLMFSQGRTQKRLYHSVICAPREVRRALRLDGMPLVEVDIKTSQPFLLLNVCPDEEREAYRELLRGDVYAISNSGRERAKKEFGQFAFGEYKRKNSFGESFIARFPRFAEVIRNYPSLCAFLQNEEAEICVYGAGARLTQEGIFWVGIHDGTMVRQGDAARAAQVIREEIAKRLPGEEADVRLKTLGD